MTEYFDILDTNGVPTGEVRSRADCHKFGLPHRAVHVWVMDADAKHLLIQKRAAIKESYPGKWDISAAGHVSAGDSSCDSAIRELEEEIGIKITDSSDLKLLFHVFGDKRILNKGTFIDFEYLDVYLVRISTHIEATDFVLQEEEVEQVKWIEIDELERLISSGDDSLVPCDLAKYPLFKKLRENM